MKYAYLNGRQIESREQLHAALKEQLDFPEYYGCNLDALYDLLSCEREKVCICLLFADEMEENLGSYYNRFLYTLNDVCEENENVSLVRLTQ